jgi:hypothetical protein
MAPSWKRVGCWPQPPKCSIPLTYDDLSGRSLPFVVSPARLPLRVDPPAQRPPD